MLPGELHARLRQEATRWGASVADVARDALEQYRVRPGPVGPVRFFAIGDGGQPDAAERVHEFVAEAIAPRHHRSTLTEEDVDRPIGIVDASVVALAARHHADVIATLDHRHFGVVRPRHTSAFTLVP